MKRYKLLKDLPTFDKGDIFRVDEDSGCLIREEDGVVAYAPYTLERFSILNSDWFEGIPEGKRWRAEKDEVYWCVKNDGGIADDYEQRTGIDDRLYKFGNYFKTEEEAQRTAEWIKAFAILRDDTKGFKPDWRDDDQEKWSVVYDHEVGTMSPVNYYTSQKSVLYFATRDDAEESIGAHERQWLTFFGVEE